MGTESIMKVFAFLAIANALLFVMFAQAPPEFQANETNIGETVTLEGEPTDEAKEEGFFKKAANLAIDVSICTFGALTGGVVTLLAGQGFVCDLIESGVKSGASKGAELLEKTTIGKVIVESVEGVGTFVAMTFRLIKLDIPGMPGVWKAFLGVPLFGWAFYTSVRLVRGGG